MMFSTEETFMPLMPVQISFFGGKKLGCKTSAICFFRCFCFYFAIGYWFFHAFLISIKIGGWGWGWERGKFAFVTEDCYGRGVDYYPEGEHLQSSNVAAASLFGGCQFRCLWLVEPVFFSVCLHTFGVSDCFMEVYSGELVAQLFLCGYAGSC